MRFIHLSDFHIGKRINGFSMLQDQKYIFQQILDIIDEESIEAVLISGDIYDRTSPSAEGEAVLDWFLTEIANRKLPTYIISGNHDSQLRLSFGSKFMKKSDIHISPVYDGNINVEKIKDEYGDIYIYLLPYLKLSEIRNVYPEMEADCLSDAIKYSIGKMEIDKGKRNIILSHQFVIDAAESEEQNLGGTDAVDFHVYDDFDYAALGHIHRAYSIGRKEVRYSGSPLKYSLREIFADKSVTIFDMEEKGKIDVKTVALKPVRDIKQIKGSYYEITNRDFYKNIKTDDYFHVVLTDEEEIFNAIYNLRTIYPNIMRLDYENTRTKNNNEIDALESDKALSPSELFINLYEKQNNQMPDEEKIKIIDALIEKLKEDYR